MMFKQKKRDKKSTVSLLRRFLNGENIISEVLPLSYGVACLSNDELNKVRLIKQYGVEPIEGLSVTHDGVEIGFDEWCTIQEKVKCAVVMLPANNRPSWADGEPILWAETTYPDPTIEGIRYQNPENVPSEDIEQIERSEALAASDLNDVTGRGAMLQDSNEAANEPVKGLSRKERKPFIEPQAIDKEINTYSANTERGNRYVWINGKQVDLDDMGFNEIPFHNWLNGLGRRR